MQNTSERSTDLEPLRTALAAINLADLLGPDFIARERVGVRFNEISRVAAKFGYRFVLENGNVYGRVRLEPIELTPAPVLRLITRSDHAAVTGSRRAA